MVVFANKNAFGDLQLSCYGVTVTKSDFFPDLSTGGFVPEYKRLVESRTVTVRKKTHVLRARRNLHRDLVHKVLFPASFISNLHKKHSTGLFFKFSRK